MLYNESTGKPKADVFSLESFLGWLEKQPPETSYMWLDTCGCIAHKYLVDVGARRPSGADGVLLHSVFPNMAAYHRICGTEPHTFGAALKRARALQQ